MYTIVYAVLLVVFTATLAFAAGDGNTVTTGAGADASSIQGQEQSVDNTVDNTINNTGNQQKVTIKPPSGLPMNTGVAVAPGLTSVGTFACLGSWSAALGGPGASIGVGSTKVDKGCEHARDASILMGWAMQLHGVQPVASARFMEAALRLLTMNTDTHQAVFGEIKSTSVAARIVASPPESTNFGALQSN